MQASQTKTPSLKLTLIGAAILVVVIAVAVTLTSGRRASTAPGAEQAMRYMKSDLLALVRAEAITKRSTGTYTSDPARAGLLQSLGVNVPEVTVTGDGWSAIVTSAQVPGIRCAVAVDARNPLKRSAKSGEIVCE